MLLINNTKTMIKFYIFLALVVLFMVAGGYYYLNAMKTSEGSLNINKIEKIDNIYARSVYSDYFFRVINYGESKKGWLDNLKEKVALSKNQNSKDFFSKNTFLQGYYSKLTPLKMSIGYDFSNKLNPKFILQSFDMPTKDEFSKEVGHIDESSFKDYLNKIESFKDIYSKIIATQDQHYFDESYKDTQTILNELLGKDNNITLSKKSVDDYYLVVGIPLKSLKLRYIHLEHFKIKNTLKKHQWQPNIVSWVFGNSKIILQYVDQSSMSTLNEYIDKRKKNKNELVVKTLKVKGNEVFTTQYILDDEKHTVTSFVMTGEGGHIFMLKMKTDSKSSLLLGMHDFMKINSGLSSTSNVVDQWFVTKQKEAMEYLPKIVDMSKDINELYKASGKSKVYLTEFTNVWDEKFESFKKSFGVYPSKNLYSELIKEHKTLKKEESDNSFFEKVKAKVGGLI